MLSQSLRSTLLVTLLLLCTACSVSSVERHSDSASASLLQRPRGQLPVFQLPRFSLAELKVRFGKRDCACLLCQRALSACKWRSVSPCTFASEHACRRFLPVLACKSGWKQLCLMLACWPLMAGRLMSSPPALPRHWLTMHAVLRMATCTHRSIRWSWATAASAGEPWVAVQILSRPAVH